MYQQQLRISGLGERRMEAEKSILKYNIQTSMGDIEMFYCFGCFEEFFFRGFENGQS
jgi:hypothetical protein